MAKNSTTVTETNNAGKGNSGAKPDKKAPVVSMALISDTGSSSNDRITSNPAIRGTGEANTLVTIRAADGTVLGTVMADDSGAWSFAPTGLADGAHTLTATQTDLAGNTGTATLGFTLDRAAPTMSMALISDTGSSSNDGITSNPAITGTSEANTLVTIRAAGSTVLGTVMADDTGAWSFTPTDLADGTHTLTATQIDLAGNTGTATLGFTLDRAAPTMSTALVSDTGSSSSDGITSNPAITGTGEANTLVTIRAADGTALGTVMADDTGAWSFTPTGLADGAHILSAFQTDLAGNIGTATLSFTLDSSLDSTVPVGTEGNDVLTGTRVGLNVIYGLGGNDTISVQNSNVTTWAYIDGGPGNDVLYGSSGNDFILGGDGDDHIDGGAGDDYLYTGSGNDYVQGGYGNDTIYVGLGNNLIDGGPGNDTAVFAGNYVDYGLSFANGVTTVVGIAGASSLANIETIRFQDGSYDVLERSLAPTPIPTLSPTPDSIKAPLGKQTLTVDYGKATLETFTYRPPGEIKGVLLVFHGSARNADAARNAAMKVADKYGLYVVAPKFPEDEYSSKEYQMGGMISNGKLLPEDDWTISLVDDIALWAHDQMGNDRTDETIAYGHSAGGQFVSRMAAFGPDIFDKIIVTNPSTHVRASLTEDMPYGFDGYMSSAKEEAYLMDYLADPITIHLGSEDNDPNANDLAKSAAAMRQGDTRLERGLFVYDEAKQLAESKGWDFNWELVIAGGIGHTSSGMFNAPEFQEAFDGRYVGSSIDWFA
jgi:pimeloyl-ACP methyl ester carboxylesterase/Ca2+-binding RTX toxin-like protein